PTPLRASIAVHILPSQLRIAEEAYHRWRTGRPRVATQTAPLARKITPARTRAHGALLSPSRCRPTPPCCPTSLLRQCLENIVRPPAPLPAKKKSPSPLLQKQRHQRANLHETHLLHHFDTILHFFPL
ncbi:unnamed protein product, partial [Ectocarpus sp. 12 AP-2014]